jgi:hypothetical protein
VVIVVLIIVCVFVVLLLGALSFLKNKSKTPNNEANKDCNKGVQPDTAASKKEGELSDDRSNNEASTDCKKEGELSEEDVASIVEIQPDTTSKKEGGQSTDEKTKAMYTTRKYMMMVSILVAGVTYQAGLTPPGGVWPESTDGHAAGDPVLHDTNKRRYRLFFDSNSVSFLTSLLVILLILLDEPLFGRKKKEGGAAGAFGMGCDELLRVAQTSLHQHGPATANGPDTFTTQ